MDRLNHKNIIKIIEAALEEDIGDGDITTNALVPDTIHGKAVLVAKEPCVVAGSFIAALIFDIIDKGTESCVLREEGSRVNALEPILEIKGNLKSILIAERTILNFMQRLCGIATLTRQFVDIASKYEVTILDTRKTTPVLRELEKYAVRVGGGVNHRFGLFDQVLIKDNHLKIQEIFGPDHIKRAIERSRSLNPYTMIEVEVKNKEEALAAYAAKADRMLLDNMTPSEMKEIIECCGKNIETEASGNITLQTVEAVAKTGVNYISVGALTHSARACDLSLKVVG